MTKKEQIWRHLAHEALTKHNIQFVQKELAQKFQISLSTVNHALKTLRAAGAIRVTGRFFIVEDAEKLLYIWATYHKNSIVYSTHASGAREMESNMPPGAIFTAYSGYSLRFREAPADYDKVYVYALAGELENIKKRFPEQKGYHNFFVLAEDAGLRELCEKGMAPTVQLFADLWNLSDWYAKDFLKALRERLFV